MPGNFKWSFSTWWDRHLLSWILLIASDRPIQSLPHEHLAVTMVASEHKKRRAILMLEFNKNHWCFFHSKVRNHFSVEGWADRSHRLLQTLQNSKFDHAALFFLLRTLFVLASFWTELVQEAVMWFEMHFGINSEPLNFQKKISVQNRPFYVKVSFKTCSFWALLDQELFSADFGITLARKKSTDAYTFSQFRALTIWRSPAFCQNASKAVPHETCHHPRLHQNQLWEPVASTCRPPFARNVISKTCGWMVHATVWRFLTHPMTWPEPKLYVHPPVFTLLNRARPGSCHVIWNALRDQFWAPKFPEKNQCSKSTILR